MGKLKKVAILANGGDVAGLNPVIRSIKKVCELTKKQYDNLFKGNVFINNKASNQGGAIYSAGNMGSKICPIEDNVFINNEAGMGGAIFLRGSWASKSIYATKGIFEITPSSNSICPNFIAIHSI